jgi:hypothetical protein
MTPFARIVAKTLLVCAVVTWVTPAEAGIIAFTDRTAFLAALGGSPTNDDYEAYALGDITNGSTLGNFAYTFAATVQPAIVAGGYGGQALGGPFDVFVGGDAVTLTFGGSTLNAFGADFYYAPSFDPIPGSIYQIRVDDGSGAGSVVGNLTGLDPAGGSVFLGLLADPGFEFGIVTLLSVVPVDANGDPTFLVPAYQVDNLVYDTVDVVPEPGSLSLLMLGSGALFARKRVRRFRCSN